MTANGAATGRWKTKGDTMPTDGDDEPTTAAMPRRRFVVANARDRRLAFLAPLDVAAACALLPAATANPVAVATTRLAALSQRLRNGLREPRTTSPPQAQANDGTRDRGAQQRLHRMFLDPSHHPDCALFGSVNGVMRCVGHRFRLIRGGVPAFGCVAHGHRPR